MTIPGAKAIPTTWHGINYRSRLEARWACFFSKIGWWAQYEPVVLQGYVPDFLVTMFEAPTLLVEVKPSPKNTWPRWPPQLTHSTSVR